MSTLVLVRILDAVQVACSFANINESEDVMYAGNLIVVDAEIRDTNGDLYCSPTGSIEAAVYPVDSDDVVGSMQGSPFILLALTREGEIQPGKFRSSLDTTGFNPGSYIVRMTIPYDVGAVINETVFTLVPLSPIS